MKSRLFTILATICCLLIVGVAQAQVPRTINYQGYLTTPTGAPVNNAGLQMVFNLYAVPTAGNVLHTETQTVTVTNGIFNVLLGTATTLTLPFDVPYYLGVKPGGDAEMSPRQPLASSPYAIRAATAVSATTASTASSADSLSPGATVPGSQIGNASIAASKLASSGCGSSQVLQFNGSAWICVTLPAQSGGTVTSVSAGSGLTGGTITSAGTIAADTAYLQRRVAATCAVGSSIRAIDADGSVTCQNDNVGGTGTVTNVTAGTGLTGGSIAVTGTIAADTAYLQRRVTSTCAVGASIRAIASDGTVTCQDAGNTGVPAPQPNTISTPAAVASNHGKFSSMTISTDGLPVIAFQDAGTGLVVLKCGNTTCTPALATFSIVDSAHADENSSIAIAADGLPIISYTSGTNLKVAKCNDAACATSIKTVIDAAGTTAGHPSSIAIAAGGLPIISYSGGGRLRMVRCGTTDCASGNTLINHVVANGQPHSSIAAPPDGFPVISFIQGGSLTVLKCSTAQCLTNQITTQAVDSSANFLYTSMVIGSDGLPVIAYYNPTTFELMVAKCGAEHCPPATATITVVDSVGDVGRYPSISIGLDGLPFISYYDTTNGELKLVRCGNIACSSRNIVVPMTDEPADVGQYTAMGIGGDGLPVISYYDVTAGSLKVAKCGNVFCAPYFRRR